MKKRHKLAITLIILQLSGCSIVAIGYNYADAYLRYSINSYATFNDAQKDAINKEVDQYMAWHRTNMLAQYVLFLQELLQAGQSAAPLTKTEVARFRSEGRALYVKTLQPTIRPAARILSGARPEQLEELVRSFSKENKKQRDAELSGVPDEQLRKRAEKIIDFVENLAGHLKDGQLEKVREMNRQLPFASEIYINRREDNQAGLIELLKNHKGEDAIAAFLSSWLLTPDATRSADERSIMLAFENASDDMIVAVYQMLTERQKKTLLKNIQKYIDTFQELENKT